MPKVSRRPHHDLVGACSFRRDGAPDTKPPAIPGDNVATACATRRVQGDGAVMGAEFHVSLIPGLLVIWAALAFFVVHVLAILGIGEGTPFTAPRSASQRFWRGDASALGLAISLAVLVLVFLDWGL